MKKLLLSITLFSFFFFSNTNSSLASHLRGGEITWECVSSGKFIFKVKLYRACSGVNLGTTANISNPLYAKYGGVSSISCIQIQANDLSAGCYDPNLESNCYGSSSQKAHAMEERVYLSSPVQLNGIPNVNGSSFWWSSCCRPVASLLNNISGAGYYLRAVMYPFVDPVLNDTLSIGSSTSGPTCYDSSPEFEAPPLSATCAGSFTSISVGSSDPDVDSLRYDWYIPMQSATNPITWKAGYSTTSQFPNTIHHASNIPATLDNISGFIQFKTVAPSGGLNIYCIRVSSYKKGQMVSEIFRDVPIEIFGCTPSVFTNTLPKIELKEASKANYKSSLDTAIVVGSYIELDLRSTDVDTLPTSNPTNFQSVNIEVYGLTMSSIPNTTLNCNIKPCAYLDTVGNKSWNDSLEQFLDSAQVNVKFKWQTDCRLIFPDHPYNGQPRSRKYKFTISSKDNYCPIPSQEQQVFYITVYDSTTIDEPLVEIDASSGGAIVKWNQYTKPDFKSYNLFRSLESTGPWSLRYTSTNSGNTSYNDQPARTDTASHLYALKINNNLCFETGKEVQSIFLEGVLLNAIVALDWNKPQDDPAVSGIYSVFRKYDNGTWSQIATKSYNYPVFVDFDPWQAFYNYYKVEITDSKGLTSISNEIEILRDTPAVIPGIADQYLPVVQLMPNPFNNELILIDEGGILLGQTLHIYNILGDRVFERKVEDSRLEMDLTTLNPGVYFAHYRDKFGNVGSRRLVKME